MLHVAIDIIKYNMKQHLIIYLYRRNVLSNFSNVLIIRILIVQSFCVFTH